MVVIESSVVGRFVENGDQGKVSINKILALIVSRLANRFPITQMEGHGPQSSKMKNVLVAGNSSNPF